MNNLRDYFYLKMAYALAEKARGLASPNPYVGAVIVNKDIIAGFGFHEGPGKPHAEAIALQKAGSLSKGSTIYITLEPCVHWGRTPPCVESIIQAKPERVVISALDPNPLVFKKGVQKIRNSGIKVSTGQLKEKNRILNECYIKYITQKTPFVTAKAAVSLDAKIATRKYVSQWISSTETREYFHLLRGEHEAIMIGANTLLKDGPRLTVRHPNWKGKKITRVILDSRLRFPTKARLLSTLGQGHIIVFTHVKSSTRKAQALIKKGIEIVTLPSASSLIEPKKVLEYLGKREISSLLVEGGGKLLTSMFEKKLVDKVFLSFSPIFIGGEKSPSFFQGKGASLLKNSLKLKRIRCFQIGRDYIMEAYI